MNPTRYSLYERICEVPVQRGIRQWGVWEPQAPMKPFFCPGLGGFARRPAGKETLEDVLPIQTTLLE